MALLINTVTLRFLKAAKTVEQLEYWAEILCPNDNFLIVDTHKKVYSIFTEMELKVLYGNTVMQDLSHVVPESYNKLLNEVVNLGTGIPQDETSVEELQARLGRPIGKPSTTPGKEKPPRPPKKSSSRGQSSPSTIKRPKAGTTTAKVWEIADKMHENDPGLGIMSKEFRNCVVEECVKEGINPSTAATQFGKWKGSK